MLRQTFWTKPMNQKSWIAVKVLRYTKNYLDMIGTEKLLGHAFDWEINWLELLRCCYHPSLTLKLLTVVPETGWMILYPFRERLFVFTDLQLLVLHFSIPSRWYFSHSWTDKAGWNGLGSRPGFHRGPTPGSMGPSKEAEIRKPGSAEGSHQLIPELLMI